MIRRPPRSTPFPTRRSSDLHLVGLEGNPYARRLKRPQSRAESRIRSCRGLLDICAGAPEWDQNRLVHGKTCVLHTVRNAHYARGTGPKAAKSLGTTQAQAQGKPAIARTPSARENR